jgi:hypothetical protein
MIDKDADPEHWKKIIFVIILEVPDEKSRIRRQIHIRISKNYIGSGALQHRKPYFGIAPRLTLSRGASIAEVLVVLLLLLLLQELELL